jgi:hypothetical protein
MVRAFQECFKDPALAGVLGLAVIIIAVLVAAIGRDKLQRRRMHREVARRSREAKEKHRKILASAGRKPSGSAKL